MQQVKWKPNKPRLAEVVAFGVLFGVSLTWGIATVYVGFQHNNQGEYFDTESGEIHVLYMIYRLFLPSFPVLVAAVLFALSRRRSLERK